MPETIVINCGSIEDATPYVDGDGDVKIEVTLADVEVDLIIQEIGMENILSEMKEEEVMQYYLEKRQLKEEELRNA